MRFPVGLRLGMRDRQKERGKVWASLGAERMKCVVPAVVWAVFGGMAAGVVVGGAAEAEGVAGDRPGPGGWYALGAHSVAAWGGGVANGGGMVVEDRSGRVVAELLMGGESWHRPLALDAMGSRLVLAVLAAEDARFWEHNGVDGLAVARAVCDAVRAGRVVSGGSTITQQLVKLGGGRVGSPGRWTAKLREMGLALELERQAAKREVLEAYLNSVDFGRLRRGVGAAAEFYFGKEPRALSWAESAMLAGMIQAPSRLCPLRNPEGARQRQREVLRRLLERGWVSQEEWARAVGEEPALTGRPGPMVGEGLMPLVELLVSRKGQEDRAGRGMSADNGRLRVTLDAELTRKVTAILRRQLGGLGAGGPDAAAAVVIENASGEVLVLAEAEKEAPDAESRAQQARGLVWHPRSPGSALKPFVYALALERGAFPGTVIADVPTEWRTPTGVYRPRNFDHRFRGPVTLREALGNSLNVPALRVLDAHGGPQRLYEVLLALGFTSLGHPPAHYGLGLALGNGEVRLIELANAYAALARGGVWRPWRVLREGSVTGQSSSGGRRVFSEETAWLLADVLADNAARVETFGPDSVLRLPFPAAVKTGTSSNYRDNLAAGFVREFTVAVWAGRWSGEPMRGVTGVTGAAPAMREIFLELARTHGVSWLERPEGVSRWLVHKLNGRCWRGEGPPPGRPEEWCGEWAAGAPPEAGAEDFDEEGRALLGREFEEWMERMAGPGWAQRVALGQRGGGLTVVHPQEGAVFFFDRDLPAEFQRLRPVAAGARAPVWWCATLGVPDEHGGFRLKPGLHELVVEDAATGERASVRVRVVEL